MDGSLKSAVDRLNRIKSRSAVKGTLLRVLRAALLATMTLTLWALVRPHEELEQLALGALAFVIALLASFNRNKDRTIAVQDLALALEMQHAHETAAGFDSSQVDQPLPESWRPHVEAQVKELRDFEASRNLALATTLLVPLIVSFVTLPNAAPSFKLAFSEVSKVVSRLSRGANLRVVQGSTENTGDKPIALSAGKPVEVELLAQNLIEVNVTGGGFGKSVPVVELRKSAAADGAKQDVYQSFQMMPVRDSHAADSDDDGTNHTVSFAVTEPVELYIPALGGDRAMAKLKVRQLPIPKVTLKVAGELEDPWPDDQPLNLKIVVKAENPLQTVRLLIKSGQRVSKELVANVMAEDKQVVATDYRLVLEQYVESDLAQVEIVAEAVDRAVPTPLVGYSEPLKINTASAYGRYRQALQTLRELKQKLDDTVAKQEQRLPHEAKELAKKAAAQSETSPFFDGLDRVQIHRFEAKVQDLAETSNAEQTLELSQNLNDFLFEHEILDDRERDRDFFVAARGLSRLVEQEAGKRPVQVKTVTDRLRNFLTDRYDRWEKRVARIDEAHRPPSWSRIKHQKPFHAALEQIDKLEAQIAGQDKLQLKSDQLTALSKSVVDYRAWIEELEAKEDAAREAEDRQRQEGLANARNTLRELQQRQGEISAELDRAGERPKDEMAGQWPGARMKQNTNTKETRHLESQMRSLSPTANHRIKAAIEAMEATSEAGNAGNFETAESSSDLSGRLLRQAESAAAQSQQKRRSRGRRRPVTGDNYYGQSVVGGDIEIKREYEVDRRYREDILDEVQGSQYDEEQRVMIENYLRQVIR